MLPQPVVLLQARISLLPIYGEQIGHHLAGYGEGGPVAVSFLHLFFMNQGQLAALSRRQLRSFHQHVLDMSPD